MRRLYVAARLFNLALLLGGVTYYADWAGRPQTLPARGPDPSRVVALAAYYGLEGAGPGTVGRL